jgi:3-hydroxyacyl-CoA dehydrogenase/enoyl-CoA hydratase/3-hydroxybutyryl-CoA epimerase
MTPFSTDNLRIEPAPSGRALLWLDVAGRSVNVFHRQLMADLDAAFDHLAADSALRVLVVRSAKPSGFIAGADLNEFTAIRSPAEASALSDRGQRLFDKLAELRCPTIAVIHGPCLGGGLEFALACDYRLVVDQPKTQLGLPEIELGLLPGWGGTQRLPRVIGLEAALKIILGGKRLNASQALRWHLADALATDRELETALDRLCERAEREGKRPKGLPLCSWRQWVLESNSVGRSVIFWGSARVLRQRVPDDMPAPYEAQEAVRVGLRSGLPAGLAYEREAVGRLAVTPACHNLVNLFFQREKAKKLPAELRGDLVRPIRKVGVVGAGTMGAGIAQLAAVRGCEVVVQEVNDAALAAGMQKIDALFQKAVENRILSEAEAAKKRAAIRGTTTWEGFGDLDLAVEAVIEDLDLKRGVFRELERRTRPETFLATNTSSLLVERLQEGSARPERLGGLHFFNPVHKMPLAEVVRAPATDEATVGSLTQWAIDVGKTPVVVKDSPGFVVNRILMPYLNEAVVLLAERMNAADLGAGATAGIDRVMRRFGMPMGPLEVLDQVGIDVAAHVERSLRPAFADRFTPNPAFGRMLERGWFGQKSGAGFYLYKGKSKKPNPQIRQVFSEDMVSRQQGDHSDGDVRDRLVLLMVNEAAACLAEGIAANPDTIDLAMVFGTGWAPHRGGPLHYADTVGLATVVKRLDELARSHGPRFEPCAELRRRTEGGEPFYPAAEALAAMG